MKHYSRIIIVFLILLGLMPSLHAASSAELLFQGALMKETGERDPEAAIGLYQNVINGAGTDQKLKFKAQFRMAGCYERLGKSKNAEKIYLQIIDESASVSSEVVQEALSNLRRIQAHEKDMPAPQKPMVLASRYEESPFSFALGGALLSTNDKPQARPVAAVRYRILRSQAPLSLFLEAGALTPGGNKSVAEQTKPSDFETLDHGVLRLEYQVHLALISELPHGRQRWVIPEGGAGIALTSANVQVDPTLIGSSIVPGFTSNAESVRIAINPYFSAGLHFFPDHLFSFIFQGSYIACPSPETVQIPAQTYLTVNNGNYENVPVPAHTQSFSFPSSFWDISLKLQIKFGGSKLVLEPAS